MVNLRPFLSAAGLAASMALAAPALAMDFNSALGGLQSGAPVNAAPAGSPINGAVMNAPQYDPIDGTLNSLGLPTTGTLPVAAGVIVSGAAGALASPDPVGSTVKYIEFRATSALDLVGNGAGGAVPAD